MLASPWFPQQKANRIFPIEFWIIANNLCVTNKCDSYTFKIIFICGENKLDFEA